MVKKQQIKSNIIQWNHIYFFYKFSKLCYLSLDAVLLLNLYCKVSSGEYIWFDISKDSLQACFKTYKNDSIYLPSKILKITTTTPFSFETSRICEYAR